MDGVSPILSRQKNGNHSSLSIGTISSSDAMVDFATNLAAMNHPYPIDNDSGGPSNGPHITSASILKLPTAGISSDDILSDTEHRDDQEMSAIQCDNQRHTQNRMRIDFILNSNSPTLDGSPNATATDNDSTFHIHASGSTASATHQMESCPCYLSHRTMEQLKSLRSHCQKQIELYEKSIRNVEASRTLGTSGDQSIHSSLEHFGELNKENNRIVQNLKSEIKNVGHRSTHIARHQEQADEEDRKAKKMPLQFMADGSKSTIYKIPESSGDLVLKVGPLSVIIQERLNILRLAQACEKVKPSTWNRSPSSRLKPLLFPNVIDVVPAGWEQVNTPGLVRPCENLDPRIPDYHDTNGDRMHVDAEEQIGIVLGRVGDLQNASCRKLLQRCYDLQNPELEDILRRNDHRLVRIYLNDDESEDAWETISDVTMQDAMESASATTFGNEPPSTLNLPLYFDHVIKACRNRSRPVLESLAQEIAFGYALLHWGARLDGRGIEFILGSSPMGIGKRLYMLDFEGCRPAGELTAQWVRDQLVPAAVENDPYIPRAISGDSGERIFWDAYGTIYWAYTSRSHRIYAWEVFVERYLDASNMIWETSSRDFDSGLPELFIEELKRKFLWGDLGSHADGDLDHYTASEDGTDDPTDQNGDAETTQAGGDSQEGPVYDGNGEDNQGQDDDESFENGHYGNDAYDSDPMDTSDWSEGDENSDEDDDDEDDYDDVD